MVDSGELKSSIKLLQFEVDFLKGEIQLERFWIIDDELAL